MKEFLGKCKAQKIETSADEGNLTLETAKKQILKLLTENIKNLKENNWNLQNRPCRDVLFFNRLKARIVVADDFSVFNVRNAAVIAVIMPMVMN